jgi:hypothetical protein
MRWRVGRRLARRNFPRSKWTGQAFIASPVWALLGGKVLSSANRSNFQHWGQGRKGAAVPL